MGMGGSGGGNVLAALQEQNVMIKRDGGYKDSVKLSWIVIYVKHSCSEYLSNGIIWCVVKNAS